MTGLPAPDPTPAPVPIPNTKTSYYRQETSSYHFSPRSKFRCSYGFAFLCQFRVPFVPIACVPVAGSY